MPIGAFSNALRKRASASTRACLDLRDLGDVLAHADDPLHLARRRVHDRLALAADAADVSVGPDDAVLEAERNRVAECGLDLPANLDLLVRVDALEIRGEGDSERMRVLLSLDTEDPVELLRPKTSSSASRHSQLPKLATRCASDIRSAAARSSSVARCARSVPSSTRDVSCAEGRPNRLLVGRSPPPDPRVPPDSIEFSTYRRPRGACDRTFVRQAAKTVTSLPETR